MAKLTSLVGLVRAKCPGVIDIIYYDALAQAFSEFCRESKVVQKTQAGTSSSSSITLAPSTQYIPFEIMSVKNDKGVDLKDVTDFSISKDSPDSIKFTRSGVKFSVEFAEMPKATFDVHAGEVSQYILDRWGQVIAMGAASILRKQPGTEWFNPELSADLRADFVAGYREAYRTHLENYASKKPRRKHTFY